MRRIFLVIGVAVLLFGSFCEPKKRDRSSKKFWGRNDPVEEVYIDEDDASGDGGYVESTTTDHTHVDEEDDDSMDVEFSGDGAKKIKTEDNDDEDLEGSGSGAGALTATTPKAPVKPSPTTIKTTTSKALTPCQQLSKDPQSIHYVGFVYNCTAEGKFHAVQCLGKTPKKECWCVDPEFGKEINGTRMAEPKGPPDCEFGFNLKTCVFLKVQNSHGGLGSYNPNCTANFDFAPLQCHETQCWCVDKDGTQIPGSFKKVWEPRPNCDQLMDKTKPSRPEKPTEKPKNFGDVDIKDKGDGYVVPTEESESNEEVDNVIPIDNIKNNGKIPIDEDEPEEKEEKTNSIEDEVDNKSGVYAEHSGSSAQATVLGQPGILAAVIGGAVVGLLCMVLLVMFVVYRVRKKDEGSYPLDDKNYQNYSYAKAPDKEFYA